MQCTNEESMTAVIYCTVWPQR